MTNEVKMKGAGSALSSDEPIHSAEQDRLGRLPFVKVLSHHIRNVDAHEAVVIAINAPWGAGKSSFLNLLERDLLTSSTAVAGAAEAAPIVIRFNAWHYTSIDQLVRMFFDELARGIGKASSKRIAKKIGELLRKAGIIATFFNAGTAAALKDAGRLLKEERGLPQPSTSSYRSFRSRSWYSSTILIA